MEQTGTPSTDPSLLFLLRTLDNNDQAWQIFVERYRPAMVTWCRAHGLQSADVDEVVSRVLANLATAMRRFEYDPSLRFRGWLKRVVTRTVFNWLRERRRHPWLVGQGEDGHWQFEQMVDPRSVQDLAQQLDDRVTSDEQLFARAMALVQQQVEIQTWSAFFETAIRGRGADEVASELAMNRSTVYMAKSRVIAKLKLTIRTLIQGTEPTDS